MPPKEGHSPLPSPEASSSNQNELGKHLRAVPEADLPQIQHGSEAEIIKRWKAGLDELEEETAKAKEPMSDAEYLIKKSEEYNNSLKPSTGGGKSAETEKPTPTESKTTTKLAQEKKERVKPAAKKRAPEEKVAPAPERKEGSKPATAETPEAAETAKEKSVDSPTLEAEKDLAAKRELYARLQRELAKAEKENTRWSNVKKALKGSIEGNPDLARVRLAKDEAEQGYFNAQMALGRKMTGEEEGKLRKGGFSEQEIESRLLKYKAGEVYTRIVLQEEAQLEETLQSLEPKKEKGFIRKGVEWYGKQNKHLRAAGTAIAYGGIVAAVAAPAVAAYFFGRKWLGAYAVMGGIYLGAKGAEKFGNRRERKGQEKFGAEEAEQRRRIESGEKEFNLIELANTRILAKKKVRYERNTNRMKKGIILAGAGAGGIVGGSVFSSAAQGMEAADEAVRAARQASEDASASRFETNLPEEANMSEETIARAKRVGGPYENTSNLTPDDEMARAQKASGPYSNLGNPPDELEQEFRAYKNTSGGSPDQDITRAYPPEKGSGIDNTTEDVRHFNRTRAETLIDNSREDIRHLPEKPVRSGIDNGIEDIGKNSRIAAEPRSGRSMDTMPDEDMARAQKASGPYKNLGNPPDEEMKRAMEAGLLKPAIHEVVKGETNLNKALWSELKSRGLDRLIPESRGAQTNFIENLKKYYAGMSPEELKRYIPSGDLNKLRLGDRVGFPMLNDADFLDKQIARANNLTMEQVNSIEDYRAPRGAGAVAAQTVPEDRYTFESGRNSGADQIKVSPEQVDKAQELFLKEAFKEPWYTPWARGGEDAFAWTEGKKLKAVEVLDFKGEYGGQGGADGGADYGKLGKTSLRNLDLLKLKEVLSNLQTETGISPTTGQSVEKYVAEAIKRKISS